MDGLGAGEATGTLYDLLGCPLQATPELLKAQFQRLALEHHPDKSGDSQQFQRIHAAWQQLRDPQKRAAYDTQLVHLLDMQVFCKRFEDLVLTVQGLSLPPHLAHLHSTCPSNEQQQEQQQRQPYRCNRPEREHAQTSRPSLLTRC